MSGGGASKACTSCSVDVPLAGFSAQKSNPDGLRYRCKACEQVYMATWRAKTRGRHLTPEQHAAKKARDVARYTKDPTVFRDSYLRRYYNISVEQYDEMLAAQGGRCAICRGVEEKQLLSVDHDHACCPSKKSCGKCVRGLLCSSCNHGLGRFRDDIGLLEQAITYLSSTRS